MSIIKLNNISKNFGEKQIFNKICLDINQGEKIGIVGVNGSGKSTLIKIIMGYETPDSGTINISPNANIGYLKQTTEYSLTDFIEMASNKKETSNFLKLTNELNLSQSIDFSNERLKNLSGGEKTKVTLASILASNPNILLLDEPTNHLDIKSIDWLINVLKQYKGTLLIVSHDRYFLNETVTKIIEVEQGNIKIYHGNYDEYQVQKEKELETQKEQYEREQKQDKKIQQEINKLRQWSEKGEKTAGRQGGSPKDAKGSGVKGYHKKRAAKVARSSKNKQSRLKQLRKDYIEKPFENKDIKFHFNDSSSGANNLIKINNLSKSFNRNIIFKDVNLSINPTEKIGLIGPNGSGKSTFIKILMEKLNQDTGEVWKTPSLKVAYMSQDVFDLKENKTILDLANNYDSEKKQLFYNGLVNMGYERNQFKNHIKTLSLGQRMRLKLIQIIVDDYNLIILDEPTNHLDLDSKIELENALIKFKGAILIATHDKYLLTKVVNKVFVFQNKTITRYEDNYEEYQEKQEGETK